MPLEEYVETYKNLEKDKFVKRESSPNRLTRYSAYPGGKDIESPRR